MLLSLLHCTGLSLPGSESQTSKSLNVGDVGYDLSFQVLCRRDVERDARLFDIESVCIVTVHVFEHRI